jgi:hypothetical protein
MPVEYQCSSCSYPVAPNVAACPNCKASFSKNYGDTKNYTPIFSNSVGLGAATFTWMEALGFLAVGVVAGMVGSKYLQKL